MRDGAKVRGLLIWTEQDAALFPLGLFGRRGGGLPLATATALPVLHTSLRNPPRKTFYLFLFVFLLWKLEKMEPEEEAPHVLQMQPIVLGPSFPIL